MTKNREYPILLIDYANCITQRERALRKERQYESDHQRCGPAGGGVHRHGVPHDQQYALRLRRDQGEGLSGHRGAGLHARRLRPQLPHGQEKDHRLYRAGYLQQVFRHHDRGGGAPALRPGLPPDHRQHQGEHGAGGEHHPSFDRGTGGRAADRQHHRRLRPV